ncbi:MAG: BamA/TamA family outer membrane protein [Gemmatimonadetes bacterium]|nr:BamA/TamA family outer membrane protein [Gemmatimonadota bacterium]
MGSSLVLAGAAAAQSGTPGGAETPCPEGRISNVFIDNHSIYDLEQIGAPGAARRFYEIANALHVKTRAAFIRSELLFHEGECYDPLLLSESGRILRSYPFIARADLFAVAQPDGTKHVVVDTQDEWTTKVDLGVSVDGGLTLETLQLKEEDVLGRGIQATLFLRQRQERKDAGARVAFPRLLGTRTNLLLSAGRTRDGRFREEALTYPFVGEIGRFAVRQTYLRRDELFPYSVGMGGGFSHVLLPYLDDRLEVSFAGRIGRPGKLTLMGFGVSRETLDFAGFPGTLAIAHNSDFGAPAPAPDSLSNVVAPQAMATSTTRVDVLLGQRNLRFVRARGLDPLNGEQDIQLGTDVGLTVGRSINALSASGLPSSNDLYARGRFFFGSHPGTSYIFFNANVEGRDVLGDSSGRGWHDVIGEVDVYSYLRSPGTPHQTVFARVSGAGGWAMQSPFQLTLGGRSSVRGFRERDFPGARRLIATVEDRVFLSWPAPDIVDFGFTLFADAGRVWRGDVPFSATSGWKAAVGGGIRLGFPPGSRLVARMDLAFPLLDTVRRSPVFRVTLYELLGLATGFADPQLDRSRRITVGPDYFTQEGG